MTDFHDDLETRDPAMREAALFGRAVHLRHFRLRDVQYVDPAHAESSIVNREHDGGRLGWALLENLLQHRDDELHRSVIVVVQNHLVTRRPRDLGPGRGRHATLATRIASLRIAVFRPPRVAHGCENSGER